MRMALKFQVILIFVLSLSGCGYWGYSARRDTLTGESWKQVRAELEFKSWIIVVDGLKEPRLQETKCGYIYARKNDNDDNIYVTINFFRDLKINKLIYKTTTGSTAEIIVNEKGLPGPIDTLYKGVIGINEIELIGIKNPLPIVETIAMNKEQFRDAFLGVKPVLRVESDKKFIDFQLTGRAKRYIKEFATKAEIIP